MQTIAAQFGGEQLAYIAAFATGAALIFGDRPKVATFARLAALPSLRELDAAFGLQSALNYRCGEDNRHTPKELYCGLAVIKLTQH